MPSRIIRASDDDPAGWGSVPTTDGSSASAIPNPVTGTSPTQDQQGSTATVQSLAQSIFLPPAPVTSPVLMADGRMSAPWVMWFQKLNQKLGGYTATPTDDALVLGYEAGTEDAGARAMIQALQSDFPSSAYMPISPDVSQLWDAPIPSTPDQLMLDPWAGLAPVPTPYPTAFPFTPTANGFTVTGSPTYSGRAMRIGHLAIVWVKISPNGGTVATTGGGVSYFTGIPFSAVQQVGGTITDSSVPGTGYGEIFMQTTTLYLPTMSAASANRFITTIFEVA